MYLVDIKNIDVFPSIHLWQHHKIYVCFDYLFSAMIDSIGGPVKVNNMLSTLNIKPISNKNLMKMQRRAGAAVETVSKRLAKEAAAKAFQQEMK